MKKEKSGLGHFKVLFTYQTFLKANHFIIYGVLYVLIFPSHYYVSVDLRINLQGRIGAVLISLTLNLRPASVTLPRSAACVRAETGRTRSHSAPG